MSVNDNVISVRIVAKLSDSTEPLRRRGGEREARRNAFSRFGKLQVSDLTWSDATGTGTYNSWSLFEHYHWMNGVLQQPAPKWRCLHDTSAGKLEDESRGRLHLRRLQAIGTKQSRSIMETVLRHGGWLRRHRACDVWEPER